VYSSSVRAGLGHYPAGDRFSLNGRTDDMFNSSIKLGVLALVALVGSAAAQQPPAPAVTRTPLLTTDLAMPAGYVASLVSVILPAGSREGRHVHSGSLLVYVAEGALTLDYEGKPTVTYKAGETFSVEPGKVHEGMNKGNVTTRLVATFVFPKDQPMTTPVKE
jgi:quercetin dioxygenase-like cupin family protein